jgi:hypothetical protein
MGTAAAAASSAVAGGFDLGRAGQIWAIGLDLGLWAQAGS